MGGTKEKQTVPPSVDLVFFDFCHFGPCDVQEPESIYISSRRGWMSLSYKVLSFSALRSPLLLIRSLRPGDRVRSRGHEDREGGGMQLGGGGGLRGVGVEARLPSCERMPWEQTKGLSPVDIQCRIPICP